MWSVVVVDDEKPFREEILSLPLEPYGYQIVAEASNGKEALEVCRKIKPDIVLTDINMPVMDGLVFISHLVKEMPLTKFIILTCHQDFEYARRAIEHNAVDYVLKADICTEGIACALDKAKAVIEKEHWYIDKLKEENSVKILEHSMRDDSLVQLEQDLKKLDFKINENNQNCWLVMENRIGSWAFVELMVREMLKESNVVKSWVLLGDGIYGVIFKENPESFMESLEKNVQRTFPFVKDNFHFFIVISHKCLLNSRQYIDRKHKVTEWNAQAYYYPETLMFEEEKIDGFAVCNERLWDAFEREVVHKISDQVNAKDAFTRWSRHMRLWPSELIKFMIGWMEKVNPDLKPAYIKALEEKLKGARDIVALAETFELDFWLEIVSLERSEVRKAVRVIKNRYAEALSMADVAEEIGMTSWYLGKLFQEETGEKFGDYLNRVRMEQARKLLEEGDLKVYEVGSRVGISNYRYFTQKYREWYGITPKEVRKKTGGKDS